MTILLFEIRCFFAENVIIVKHTLVFSAFKENPIFLHNRLFNVYFFKMLYFYEAIFTDLLSTELFFYS
jgi:hypothetical protein